MVKRLTMMLAGLFLCLGVALAQTQVSGTVVDENGEPVVGAAVRVTGTKTGTVTDVDGKFSISASKDARLEISYIGMQNKSVKAASNMRITLDADNQNLDEVMVVAYGTTKKSSFTGSADVISSDKLASRPVTNVTKALDGQLAGVSVTSGSGQPGSGASINIRGFGSINASNTPLYVVDGFPYDGSISAISPQDIESMTVLKDASASALYGSRAANGVVIITTKKGKEGAPKVSLHNTVGWAWRAIPEYQMVNQSDFVQLSYESLRNDYQFKNGMSYEDASATAIAQLGATLGGKANPELYNPFKNYTWSTLIDPATGMIHSDATPAWNESWMDELYNKGALRHEHELQITGGTDRTHYMFSLGYLSEDGILKNTSYERYNGRGSVDSQVTDWFKAGLSTAVAYTKSKFNQYSGSSNSNVWYSAQFIGPIYPMYIKDLAGKDVLDTYGNRQLDYGEDGRPQYNDYNPLGGLTADRSYSESDHTNVTTFVEFGSDKDSYGWAKGLKFKVDFGANIVSSDETDMMNKFHGNQANNGGLMEKYHDRTMSYTFGQQLTWNRKFAEHTLGALFRHEFYNYKYRYLYAAKNNIVDGIDELRPASTLIGGDSYTNELAIESYLGRINYNYADKYYFDASLRTDGNSRFYKDNRWGTFWSIGANWRISSEQFMKPLTWLNNLSFKISYGENGNDAIGSLYAWQNLYSLDYPNANQIGGFVSTLENKAVSWEKIGMLNVGLEGTVLNNRMRFSVEFFNKKTSDMLLSYPMALSTGFSGYNANVGNMRNVGWEFLLSGTIVQSKNVRWDLTWNGTTIKNKVLKLTEGSNQINNGIQIIKEGYDLHTFYMAKSAGVDPLTGAQLYYAYESMDDDGNATGEYVTSDYSVAQSHRYFVGKRTPDFYGGISSNLNLFNCIDFSITTAYSIGGKIYDSLYTGSMNNMYYGNGWNENILRRWQQPGDITDIPRVQVGASRAANDADLINASYFAIKNITLGYTLPKSLARKIYLESVRLYTSFDNVALFSHLKGMDPQYNFTGTTDYSYTPNKTFSVGLDINF